MEGLLEALYDRFYTPREITELKRSMEANHALLRDKLSAEQRKIVLRIVDDLTMMANEGSLDSFLWRIQAGMAAYKRTKSLRERAFNADSYDGRADNRARLPD